MMDFHPSWKPHMEWAARVKERIDSDDYQGLKSDRTMARIMYPSEYLRKAAATALAYKGVPLEASVWLLAADLGFETYEQLWWIEQRRKWLRLARKLLNRLR